MIDGHYLHSFVIWNDFDPRGHAVWGYDGCPLDEAALTALPGNARLEWSGELRIWLKRGLDDLFEKGFFGRSAHGIEQICRNAYARLQAIEGEARSALPFSPALFDAEDNFRMMAQYVDPFNDRSRYFAPDHSVLQNLPRHQLKTELPGFSVAGGHRYVLLLDKYRGPLTALIEAFAGYHVSAEVNGPIIVQCWDESPECILEHANRLKKIAIGLQADHYEPADLSEVREFFYQAMPGGGIA